MSKLMNMSVNAVETRPQWLSKVWTPLVLIGVVAGCSSAPRVATPVTAAAPATDSTEPTDSTGPKDGRRTPRTLVYAERSVCDDPEATRYLTPERRAAALRGCCETSRSPLIAFDPIGMGQRAELRIGHQETACGPEPLRLDASREPSNNTSERLQPNGRVLEVGW